MAEIINLVPNIDNNTENVDTEPNVVPITHGTNNQEEVIFETQVHFTPEIGFHLRDKSGQHIYQVNGVLQNMVMQIVSAFMQNTQ